MKWLNRLERRFGRYALPNLTVLLVAGQSVGFIIGSADPARLENWSLVPAKVLEGEVWRLVLFPFLPPTLSLFWVFFALYLFYIMGTGLQQHWGAFRFNLFMLIGYLATVAVSFLEPEMPMSNAYLGGSVFLAFAWLYPDFELLLFFILPVKIKYFAWLTWLFFAFGFFSGTAVTRLALVASVSNFLLFFGADIVSYLRYRHRRTHHALKAIGRKDAAFHECVVCGVTDLSDRNMEFRYCADCDGDFEYCADHLRDHEHRTAENADAQS